MIVGDLVLGTPAALGFRIEHLPPHERDVLHLGMVIGKTQLLSYRLPAMIVLYEVGVYEIFNCDHFYVSHHITPFHSTQFSGYKFADTITLIKQYSQGLFDAVLNPEIKGHMVEYVMEKDG